jgi:hypothetical protein
MNVATGTAAKAVLLLFPIYKSQLSLLNSFKVYIFSTYIVKIKIFVAPVSITIHFTASWVLGKQRKIYLVRKTDRLFLFLLFMGAPELGEEEQWKILHISKKLRLI